MSGNEFREFVGGFAEYPNDDKVANLDNMKKIRLHTKVLARATPEDKKLMVIGLK
jgi:magnesium-transporting ATPase (P-type)